MLQIASRKDQVLIGLVLIILTLSVGGYYYNKYSVKKADEAGEERGQHIGYSLGKFASEEVAANEQRLALETALKGASIVLADEFLSTEIGYQKTINELLNKKNNSEPMIKSIISSFTGDVNYMVLETITNHGDFSEVERKRILNKFERNRKLVGQQAYDNYVKHIARIEQKDRVFERVKALVNSTKDLSCTYLSVLTPVQRSYIASRLLQAGSLGKSKFGKASIGFIGDQLCHIVVYNLVTSLAGAMMDYATIVKFTEEELVGNHELQSVLKMVTAQSQQVFARRITYDRTFAVDPNFTIDVEASVLAGIDLQKNYSVEIYPRELTSSRVTEIVITIPNPEIISINTTIRTNSENVMFATGLKDHEQNDMIATTKEQAKSRALQEGILTKARDGAEDALMLIYAPLLFNSASEYDIIVRFSDDVKGKSRYSLKG